MSRGNAPEFGASGLTARPRLLLTVMAAASALLLANVVALLVLRHQIEVEGVPTAADREGGIPLSDAAHAYGSLVSAGLLLVIPLAIVVAVGGIFAGRIPGRTYDRVSVASIVFVALILVATPAAGILILGFGW